MSPRALRLCASTMIAVALVSGCRNDRSAPTEPSAAPDSLLALPRAVSTAERQGVATLNAFSLRLLKDVTRSSTGNVLLSPYSVSAALGMTMNGAAGTTDDAFRATLGWGQQPRAAINAAYRDLAALLPSLDTAVVFRSVNGLWVRDPLRAAPQFAADARTYFNANVSTAATPQAMFDAVNAWASAATDGMIPRALDTPPPDDLALLLANALLFKGSWRVQFDRSRTAPAPFALESGAPVTVPMMSGKGAFRTYQRGALTAVELPYGNAAYSMLLVLPTAGSVASLVSTLDSATLADIVGGLTARRETPVLLPRFRISSSAELRPNLSALGLGVAFTRNANFSGLFTDATPAQLAFVRHAVTVDVDEAGTKAAAVTVVGVVAVSAPVPIAFDRPFLFFIRERFTGALLFAGVVRDPRS